MCQPQLVSHEFRILRNSTGNHILRRTKRSRTTLSSRAKRILRPHALSSNGSASNSNHFQRRISTALALSCYDATNIKPCNDNDISQLCQKALLDGRRASMPQLMVVLGVTFTTSWQQDCLVQRELFDKKTSRVVPDYYDIEVDGFDGQVYGYWPAKKCCFDSMLSPTVRAEVRARLFHLVVTSQGYATRFRNLCHEASADYTAIMELPFDQASAQCRVTILHEICMMLGLTSSHDTTTVVRQSTLDVFEEDLYTNVCGLYYCLPTRNRGNGPRPSDRTSQLVKLGVHLSETFRAFSGYELKKTPDADQPENRKELGSEQGQTRYKWQLVLSPKWSLMPDLIRAVTPQAEVRETFNLYPQPVLGRQNMRMLA